MNAIRTPLLLLAIALCAVGCGKEPDNATVIPDPFAPQARKPIPEEAVAARKAEILAAVALLENKQ